MHEIETDEPRPAGALEELAEDASSRKRFLKAVGGGGAASAFALFLAACGQKKTKLTPGGSNPNTGAGTGTDQYGPGDLGIARFAITVEYLEVAFYNAATKSGKLSGKTGDTLKRFGQQENQHVQALTAAIGKLGGKPPLRPKVQSFPVASQSSILKFALSLESLGAAALLGQIDRIQSKELLATAVSMHSVEGRHAGAIAELLGQNPAPQGAFAQPAFAADVLNQLHALTAQ
jgi:hypothetical protein